MLLTADRNNHASRQLAERAVFEFEGTLRLDRKNLDGRLRNTKVCSIGEIGASGVMGCENHSRPDETPRISQTISSYQLALVLCYHINSNITILLLI